MHHASLCALQVLTHGSHSRSVNACISITMANVAHSFDTEMCLCSPCAPGFFKAAQGTEPCTPCPTSASPASPHTHARSRSLARTLYQSRLSCILLPVSTSRADSVSLPPLQQHVSRDAWRQRDRQLPFMPRQVLDPTKESDGQLESMPMRRHLLSNRAQQSKRRVSRLSSGSRLQRRRNSAAGAQRLELDD